MEGHSITEGPYRYSLTREWAKDNRSRVVFIGLNPSTADSTSDDQTTKICTTFAKRWSFGALEIVNLFAYRATDPADLRKIKNYLWAVGPQNQFYLQKALQQADKIVVAWGRHETYLGRNRDKELQALFSKYELECFRLIAKGQPKHPLGVNYETVLTPYTYYRRA